MAETPIILPLREITTNKYILKLPADVLQKIDFICSQLPTREWSGTLFYNHEGSVKEGNLVILVKDFLLQDVGTGGATEFEPSADVPSYMLEKDLLDCDLGLIHSHNNMATFFSGTDIATLKSEAMDHNHFVSLIVNNAGTYTAAITTVVSSKKTIVDTYTFETFDGEESTGQTSYVTESKEIQYTRFDIEKEALPVSPFQEISIKIKEILDEKAKNAVVTPVYGNNYGQNRVYPPYPNTPANKVAPLFPQAFPKQLSLEEKFNDDFPPVEGQSFKDIPVLEDEELDYTALYEESVVNKSILEGMCQKLVACCPIIPINNDVDVPKFISNMPKLYVPFGGLKSYIEFIEAYTEFIVYTTWDNDLMNAGKALRSDEMAAVLSHHAIAYMEQLGDRNKNEYLNALLESLETLLL